MACCGGRRARSTKVHPQDAPASPHPSKPASHTRSPKQKRSTRTAGERFDDTASMGTPSFTSAHSRNQWDNRSIRSTRSNKSAHSERSEQYEVPEDRGHLAVGSIGGHMQSSHSMNNLFTGDELDPLMGHTPTPRKRSVSRTAVPATTARVHLFVGLVGPRSLFEQVERHSEAIGKGDTVRCVWHGSSPATLATLEGALAAYGPPRAKAFASMSGHNCGSDCERGYETLLLTKLRALAAEGVVVQHAITCSTINGVLQTRQSSVVQAADNNTISIKGAGDTATAARVAALLQDNALEMQTLLRLTPERSSGKRSSFVHDAKALFLAHNFDALVAGGTIKPQAVRLYYDRRGPSHADRAASFVVYGGAGAAGKGVGTDEAGGTARKEAHQRLITEGLGDVRFDCVDINDICYVAPEHALAFDALFWEWLLAVITSKGRDLEYTPVTGISVDLGCGYPASPAAKVDSLGQAVGRNPLLCQDCDDEMALNVQLLLLEGNATVQGSSDNDEQHAPAAASHTREAIAGTRRSLVDITVSGPSPSPRPSLAAHPVLEIVVGDETPLKTRWLRLREWQRERAAPLSGQAAAAAALFVCRPQQHESGTCNRGMFDSLQQTPETKTAYQWLAALCWYVAGAEALDASGEEHANLLREWTVFLDALLAKLAAWADTTAVCHTLVREAASHTTVARLQEQLREFTTYRLTADNIEDLLQYAKRVDANAEGGGAQVVPFHAFCKAPQKLAEKMLLCPPSRQSKDCILSQLLLDNPLDSMVIGKDTRIGKRPSPQTVALDVGTDSGDGVVTAQLGFVADVRCPYTKSLGPNGVALVSDGRINAFNRDKASTLSLFSHYLQFQRRNQRDLLLYTMDELRAHTGAGSAGAARTNARGTMIETLDSYSTALALSESFTAKEHHQPEAGSEDTTTPAPAPGDSPAASKGTGLDLEDVLAVLGVLTRADEAQQADDTQRYYTFRSTCQTWELAGQQGTSGAGNAGADASRLDGDGPDTADSYPTADFSCAVPHFQNFLELQPAFLAMLSADESAAYSRLLANYVFEARWYVQKFLDVHALVPAHAAPS